MRQFPSTPAEMFASLWRNRGLTYALAKREVIGRYKGSILGLFWSFFNPLFMLSIYTFIFSVVFKARWQGGSGSKTEFALILFAGLIVFNLFAECFSRAPSLIVSNANYVKKVVFPLEILPLVGLCSAMFHALISLGVWLVAYLLLYGMLHWTVLLIPLVFFPLSMFIIGLSWILASLGVYLRDVSQFVGIITTVTMFLSPIFYPVSALPEKYRHFLLLNPLGPAIEQIRGMLFWGRLPGMGGYFLYLGGMLLIAWFGFAWFQKTRKGFADVL